MGTADRLGGLTTQHVCRGPAGCPSSPHGPMAGQSLSGGWQSLRESGRTAPAGDDSCSALWSSPSGTTATAPQPLARGHVPWHAHCTQWKPTLHQGASTLFPQEAGSEGNWKTEGGVNHCPIPTRPPVCHPFQSLQRKGPCAHAGPPEAPRLSGVPRWAPNTHP